MDIRPDRSSPTARQTALDLLLRIEKGAFSDHLLESLDATAMNEKDRALVREIVLGTLRWRRPIDALLSVYLTQPLGRLPLPTLTLLRFSAYQLRHLDRVPDYAVVSEAVDLATHRDRKRAGVVNAVLRGIADLRKPEPHDPDASPIQQLALAQSAPQWLVERWVARYGIDRANTALTALNARQPVTLRMFGSTEPIIEELARNGIPYRSHPTLENLLYVDRPAGLFDTRAFESGAFIIQGPAAARMVDFADIHEGHSVLDVCAAPGGKTCVAAHRAGPRGKVVAVDRSALRLRRLIENTNRLGLQARIVAADATRLPLTGRYDRVIVDAPCSGLGTIGKHPEIKWQRGPKDLLALSRVQSEIIEAAADRVRADGVLLYSTCTTEPEENEAVIQDFLDRNPRFQPDPDAESAFLNLLPEHPGDEGGFAARLRRIA